jgi:hypothetical protein
MSKDTEVGCRVGADSRVNSQGIRVTTEKDDPAPFRFETRAVGVNTSTSGNIAGRTWVVPRLVHHL